MQMTPDPLLRAAKTRVRERLSTRTAATSASSDRGFWTHQHDQSVLAEFAMVIGVDAKLLRPEDRLQEILVVTRGELPEEFRPLMGKFGLSEIVDPYAFDILAWTENRLGQDPSKRERFRPFPRNEDEWIERLRNMTVGELVSAL